MESKQEKYKNKPSINLVDFPNTLRNFTFIPSGDGYNENLLILRIDQ